MSQAYCIHTPTFRILAALSHQSDPSGTRGAARAGAPGPRAKAGPPAPHGPQQREPPGRTMPGQPARSQDPRAEAEEEEKSCRRSGQPRFPRGRQPGGVCVPRTPHCSSAGRGLCVGHSRLPAPEPGLEKRIQLRRRAGRGKRLVRGRRAGLTGPRGLRSRDADNGSPPSRAVCGLVHPPRGPEAEGAASETRGRAAERRHGPARLTGHPRERAASTHIVRSPREPGCRAHGRSFTSSKKATLTKKSTRRNTVHSCCLPYLTENFGPRTQDALPTLKGF